MSDSTTDSHTSLDVAAMQAAIQDTIDGRLRSFVEFDADDFTVHHVDDLTRSFYDDRDHMMDHFSEIHSYVHIDFTEVDFFTEELFPISDHVRYLATSFDVFTLVRVYFDDEGIFMALDKDEPVEPVIEAVEEVYGER